MRPSARGAALAWVLAGIMLSVAPAGATAPPSPISPAAEAYAAGQDHLARRTADDLRSALQDFERATAADSAFAPAFAGLAETRALLYDYPGAREAAQRALALDDRLATAHAVLGFVRLHADWDWTGAEVEFRRALELDPARAASHLWYSILLEATSRPEEAVKEARRAVELVPGDAHLRAGLGYRLYWARRYDEAVTELTASLGLDPELATAHYFVGRCRLQQNRLDEARAAFLRARTLSPRDANLLSAVAYLDGLTGKRKEAERILAEMERLAHGGLPFDLQIAAIHAALGQRTMALDWLESALAAHEGTLVWLKIDPWFESLRREPRFAAIVKALKLAG